MNLGAVINSEDDDYKPVFSKSLDRMYFTSRRESSPDDKRNELDNKFNENIYVAYSTVMEGGDYLKNDANLKKEY